MNSFGLKVNPDIPMFSHARNIKALFSKVIFCVKIMQHKNKKSLFIRIHNYL